MGKTKKSKTEDWRNPMRRNSESLEKQREELKKVLESIENY